MDILQQLRAKLGLADTADEAAILAAVGATTIALQGALDPIAQAAGVAAGSDAAAVLAGVQQLATAKATGKEATVVALQAELTSVTNQLNTLVADTKRKAAETFVDGAIADRRVGVKPMRDDYVAMHMANPAQVEKLIGAMPILGASSTLVTPPASAGDPSLTRTDQELIQLMAIDPKKFAERRAAELAAEETVL